LTTILSAKSRYCPTIVNIVPPEHVPDFGEKDSTDGTYIMGKKKSLKSLTKV